MSFDQPGAGGKKIAVGVVVLIGCAPFQPFSWRMGWCSTRRVAAIRRQAMTPNPSAPRNALEIFSGFIG
jgi:hypothetical protein